MSDDSPSNGQNGQNNKSWLEKISQAFSDHPQNQHDVLETARYAEEQGIIDPDSLSIIEGAMQVTDMQVREVMVPRSQMITVKADQDPENYIADIVESAHSRFPVIGDTTDDVVGILLAKDLLYLAIKNKLSKDAVHDCIRPASVIPESKRLNQLLKEFKEKRNHMAIVVDEYGGIAGLVTIEDVLEQIVGEIEDEHDIDDEASIKAMESGEFHVKALTPIDEFNAYFEVSFPEDEFDTVGGLALKEFGRMPERGESTELGGFMLTVLNADNRTIRLLKVERQTEA